MPLVMQLTVRFITRLHLPGPKLSARSALGGWKLTGKQMGCAISKSGLHSNGKLNASEMSLRLMVPFTLMFACCSLR